MVDGLNALAETCTERRKTVAGPERRGGNGELGRAPFDLVSKETQKRGLHE